MPVPTTEYRERPEATTKVLFPTPRITPMKEREYTEGPKSLENFERMATAILQPPKPKIKSKKQPKVATSCKPKRSDKDKKGTCVSPAH
jgi:hypothetical protein